MKTHGGQLGYIGPVMTQTWLQGLIILAVRERKPHIGPLSDSVSLLHIFMRNTLQNKREKVQVKRESTQVWLWWNHVEEKASTVRAFIFQVLSRHMGRTISPLCSSKHLNDPNGFMLLTNETRLICTHQSFMFQRLQRSHLWSQRKRRRARRSAARDEMGKRAAAWSLALKMK